MSDAERLTPGWHARRWAQAAVEAHPGNEAVAAVKRKLDGVRVPEYIPVVVLIADETGHLTMHTLPGVQAASLRDLLGAPSWDSEGADTGHPEEVTVVPVDRLRTFASGLRQVPPGHDHYGLLKDTADALDELLDELLEDGS